MALHHGVLTRGARVSALVAMLLAAGGLGCDEETPAAGDGGADGGPSGCDVPAIFLESCDGVGCHGPMSPAGNLDLVSPGAEARVTLVAAQQCNGTLADPSDPTGSVIYQKIAPSPPCGSRMPIARPELSEEQIACVRDWISGLAPPAPPDLDMGPGADGGVVRDFALPPDRGPACAPGTVEPCYGGDEDTIGVGPCAEGTRTCREDGTGFGPCEGQVLPGVEDCRTDVDENCDGATPACGENWSLAFGTEQSESARSVAIDAEGNVYLFGDGEGTINLSGELLDPDGTKHDVVLAKFDRFGSPLWSRLYGDSSNQYATQIMVADDGNLLLLGRAFGTITFGGEVHDGVGTDDIFVAKLDPDGGYIWSRMFGGLDPDRAERMDVDSNGDVLITGTFTGVVDFGAGPYQSAGLRDAFVLKIDGRTGAHVFSKRFGGPGDDYGFGIAGTADGDILVAGRFEEGIDLGGGVLQSAGGRDIYLARLDGFGNHVWSRRYGGPDEDLAYDLAYDDAGGGFVLHGAFTGDVNFAGVEVRGAGERDIFLAAFDADDEVRWVAAYGDAADQFETDFDTNTWSAIALDGEGNIHLTGPLAGEARFGDGPPLRSAGRTDVYLVKLSPEGRFMYGNRFGTGNSELSLDVAVAPTGHVAVAGRIFGTRGVDFGAAGRVDSHGSSDGFILHVLP